MAALGASWCTARVDAVERAIVHAGDWVHGIAVKLDRVAWVELGDSAIVAVAKLGIKRCGLAVVHLNGRITERLTNPANGASEVKRVISVNLLKANLVAGFLGVQRPVSCINAVVRRCVGLVIACRHA